MDTTTLTPPPSPEASPGDGVTRAVGAAEAANTGWRRTPPAERAACLRRAADAVRDARRGLADLLCDTTGRLWSEAEESAGVAADLLEEAAIAGVGPTGRVLAGAPGHADRVQREPHGVVGVLTPWNDPYPAAAGLLAAALVTGNTVVHKPSERSSAPGLELARLIASELPDGVLAVVPGGAQEGAAIVADHRVALVAHVGSSTTGDEIRRRCAARGARCIVENGGKDAVVVDEGVDPRWAAEQIALGAFTNAGQICTSVERVYLHAAVAEEVLEKLAAEAGRWRVGDPRDDRASLSRLVDEEQLEVVRGHVDDAVARGATALTGGSRLDREGPWYPPTVLRDCTPEMTVMVEETFGPVAPVQVVRDWDEGLQQAAASRFGLAATVLTPDAVHACEAIDMLDVGTVKVNHVFGGAPSGSADPRRGSGQGTGFGPDLLGEMTLLKAVHWEPATLRH